MNKLKMLTMDLETRTLNNIMEVIAASIFNGKGYTTFYLGDYYNQETKLYNVNQMLIDAIHSLLDKKYHGYTLYLHNFSLFDAIFLFTHILDLEKIGYDIDFILREDNFIHITIKRYQLVQDKKGN